MLYTILHSSVVFFAVVISVLVLGARVTRQQLGGAALVVFGLLATAVQSTVKVALFTEPQLATSNSSGCIWMEAWGCPPHQTHRCCCGRCCCDRHR